MKQKGSYWNNLRIAFTSLWGGVKLTLRHLIMASRSNIHKSIADPAYFNAREGIATIQYPHEILPVPDTGRYRLHNEIDDCIVCDKCAKICPVDCITMEPIKATEEFGKTSDGTPKRIYAASFDIDMGKCCFCGLCTTVCPTECLTMTKVYDFSTFDIREHNYAFAEMTDEEIREKRSLLEAYQKSKAMPVQKIETKETKTETKSPGPSTARPVFKPKIKPPGKKT